MPLSLYLHIPFCTTRCSYCDFNTYAGLEDRIPPYVEALTAEIRFVAEALPAPTAAPRRPECHTVFFGGGTPSLLQVESVRRIMTSIRESFDLAAQAEVSLEANPGTVSENYLRSLRDAGINRLSFGAQSSMQAELAVLGRTHAFADVAAAVQDARSAGFDNLNLDLMFGLPFQTLGSWLETLDRALGLEPDHLSAYALSLEFGTPLRAAVEHGSVPGPDPDLAADMYEAAGDSLERAGFIQYEISNWARRRPGAAADTPVEESTFACRHNLQYWRNLPYLGFGAGAHGCAYGWRYANVRSPEAYIRAVHARSAVPSPMGPAAASREAVPESTARSDTMLLGMRLTSEGVRAADFGRRYGLPLEQVFGRELREFREAGLVEWDAQFARLTPRGRLLGNRVFEAFVGGGDR